MQAVIHDRYGPPEVLRVASVPEPRVKDHEVLIKVHAVEATKADCEMRSFQYSVKWFWLPLRLACGIRRPRRRILGSYFAGEVVGKGAAVEDFAIGDAIFGCAQIRMGAYAQYLALPASYTLAAKPRNMSFAQAAAVPLGGLNALHFMRLAHVQPGEAVLVNGAGGSIGGYGVQIAKSMGAVVTAVDSTHKQAICLQHGADHFIDYTCQDFLPADARYDVIFDMVPGSPYGRCIRALNPGGRYLCGNPRLLTMLRTVLTTRFGNKTARFAFARETREELQALAAMIEAGEIGSIVDRVMPMQDVVAAHRLVESEQRQGAIVLSIGE